MRFVRSTMLVAAVSAVALAPTAAQANTFRDTDAASDVVSFVAGSETPTPTPDRANGDVVASVVKHQRTKVLAQMTYRDLENADGFNAHVFSIKSNKVRRDVTVVSVAGISAKVVVTKPNGKRVSCHVRRTLDYTLNTVTVKVPRKCLGNPRWVKVGMASVFMTGVNTSDTQFVDDALRDGGVASGPTYSPKVRR